MGFVVALTLVTWAIRIAFPIDHWWPIFFIVPTEPAHLAQYVALFAIGAVAYRGDWLRRISTRMGILYCAWEMVICAGLCLGLMVMARELFQRTNRFLLAMSAAAYAAYMLHLGLVTLIQAAILEVDASANVKFLFVAVLGIVLSFGIAQISKWVPGLRKVLGTSPTS